MQYLNNKKLEHGLGIPLDEDYFYEYPEEVTVTSVESDIHLLPSKERKKKKEIVYGDVLIIGAGISGMQSAIDIADKGYKVILVEKTSTIGGSMVKLDKTFPTNDCSICTAAPKMVELSRHPNVMLITYGEVVSVDGEVGNFIVTVWRKSKYVDPAKCTGCGECEKVCPVEVLNTFDEKISTRKAIYIEFPQAVPIVYTIDEKNCIGCGSCDRVCDPEAISFLEKSELMDIHVGSIIVSTGFELFEPLEMRKEYGYGKYDNVITSLQFERLLSSFGPTEGKVVRPSDGKKPKSIGWIQCVGSRSSQLGFPYCSRVCCMYATKEASILKETEPDTDIVIFYMDIRAYGKDFQQYYERAKKIGVRYIRGRPASVYENPDKSLTVRYKDTLTGEVKEKTVDMLVLSTTIIPSNTNKKIAKILGIEIDENGFFKQKSLLTDPVQSSKEGIYLTGCAQGPKDIPDSVSMGSGAAAKAVAIIKDRQRTIGKKYPPERDVSHEKPRIGVFVCHCGKNIAGYVDVEKVTDSISRLSSVKHAEHVMFACSEDTCKKIKDIIREKKLNRVVVAACSPRTHGMLFQETLQESGLNKYLFEMANIRNQCSWVHSTDTANATDKAIALVHAAVAKSELLEPLSEEEFSVYPQVLIIGGGISGMKAALSLANMGIRSVIVEKEKELGGNLRNLYSLFPSDIKAKDIIEPIINEIKNNDLITVFTDAEIVSIDGFIGNYKSIIKTNGKNIELEFGTVIVATGFREVMVDDKYHYGKNKNVLTQIDFEMKFRDGKLKKPNTVVIINCVEAMNENRPYCCRIGCGVAIKNAKLISERYPDTKIYILYRDMRLFGKEEEEYYANVLNKHHVITIRYNAEKIPEIIPDKKNLEYGNLKVKVFDDILREEHVIDADLLILTVNTEGEIYTDKLRNMLKISVDNANFFVEAHPKIRPLDFSTDGVYLCGAAHYPKNLVDTIAQAEGSASRAAIPIMQEKMRSEGIVANVNEDLCSGCMVCKSVCVYSAIDFKDINGKKVAVVNKALCKGCGSCVSSCPSGAMEQFGYKTNQLDAMIRVLLNVGVCK